MSHLHHLTDLSVEIEQVELCDDLFTKSLSNLTGLVSLCISIDGPFPPQWIAQIIQLPRLESLVIQGNTTIPLDDILQSPSLISITTYCGVNGVNKKQIEVFCDKRHRERGLYYGKTIEEYFVKKQPEKKPGGVLQEK